MKYFKYISFLIIVYLLSCQNRNIHNLNWKVIDFNKIPNETLMNGYFNSINKYEFNKILTVDENHFILLGDNSGEPNEDYTKKGDEAIAFVSLDGGNTLTKHIFGKGSLTDAYFIDNTVFLVNNTSKNGKSSSQLIKTDILLTDWEVINNLKKEEIWGIHFFSTEIGIAKFGYTNSNKQKYVSQYKYTIDGGKNWTKVNDSNFANYSLLYFEFTASDKIEYIAHNNLVSLKFKTGEKSILIKKIAPEGYYCDGLSKDSKTNEYYIFIRNSNNKKDWYVKYLTTQEEIRFPKELDYVNIYGNYMHNMVKDGAYYNYIWSNDKGKTWNIEKLRNFFINPRPIQYYGEGYVFSFATFFKGSQSEKGGRFIIRKPVFNN